MGLCLLNRFLNFTFILLFFFLYFLHFNFTLHGIITYILHLTKCFRNWGLNNFLVFLFPRLARSSSRPGKEGWGVGGRDSCFGPPSEHDFNISVIIYMTYTMLIYIIYIVSFVFHILLQTAWHSFILFLIVLTVYTFIFYLIV